MGNRTIDSLSSHLSERFFIVFNSCNSILVPAPGECEMRFYAKRPTSVISAEAISHLMPENPTPISGKPYFDVRKTLSNQPVILSMSCVAPSKEAATNLVVELGDFLGAEMTALLAPPWSEAAMETRFESFRRERHSWIQLNAELASVWRSPELKPFAAQIENAQKRGALAEAQQLNQARDQKRHQLEKDIYQQWRTKAEPQLIELHSQLNSIQFTNRSERKRVLGTIAARLGGTSAGRTAPGW